MTSERAPAGILYSASGETYVAEAVRAARSSLRHNDLPHLIFAAPVPSSPPADPGLELAAFEPSGQPYLDKIANMRRSPFERTIFLDTDTHVADGIAHLIDLLDRHDLAAAHAPGYRGGPDPEVPTAFYELNTGVVVWRANERTAGFLAEWERTYARWLVEEPFTGATGILADQPAFRRCAWESGLRLIVLGPEYNFRVSKPGTPVGRVAVLHGRHPDPEALVARLNRRTGPRTYAGSIRALLSGARRHDLFRPGTRDRVGLLRLGRSILRVALRR